MPVVGKKEGGKSVTSRGCFFFKKTVIGRVHTYSNRRGVDRKKGRGSEKKKKKKKKKRTDEDDGLSRQAKLKDLHRRGGRKGQAE